MYSPGIYSFKVSEPYFAMASCGEAPPPFLSMAMLTPVMATTTAMQTAMPRLPRAAPLLPCFSRITGMTFTTVSATVISTITRVDSALMDGLTRLDMVYTRIEIFWTPLPVTK